MKKKQFIITVLISIPVCFSMCFVCSPIVPFLPILIKAIVCNWDYVKKSFIADFKELFKKPWID